jgi:purine-nucleoside phosphorylase
MSFILLKPKPLHHKDTKEIFSVPVAIRTCRVPLCLYIPLAKRFLDSSFYGDDDFLRVHQGLTTLSFSRILGCVILSDSPFFDKEIYMAGKKEAALPEQIIIAPTDPIYSIIRKVGGASDRDRSLDLFRYSMIPSCEKEAAVAGPALGAPAAALLVERLAISGVKRIILLGICGSLSPNLRIGDLFIPTGGISEEGTSRLYLEGATPPPDTGIIEEIRKACNEKGGRSSEGVIWTTDAPHRETPDKIVRYHKEGALTVDMEFTALSAVARFHKLRFAALMVVSDEIFREEPKRGFHLKEFRESLKMAAQIIIAVDG